MIIEDMIEQTPKSEKGIKNGDGRGTVEQPSNAIVSSTKPTIPTKYECCYCHKLIKFENLLLIGKNKKGNKIYRCKKHKLTIILRGEQQ